MLVFRGREHPSREVHCTITTRAVGTERISGTKHVHIPLTYTLRTTPRPSRQNPRRSPPTCCEQYTSPMCGPRASLGGTRAERERDSEPARHNLQSPPRARKNCTIKVKSTVKCDYWNLSNRNWKGANSRCEGAYELVIFRLPQHTNKCSRQQCRRPRRAMA